jgi:peptide deformylase
MAIKPILKMGEPLLLKVADQVLPEEFGSAALLGLIDDLQDTMKAMNGAGIAAPQIGVSKQVVIFGGVPSPRYPDTEPVPFTVLCNPVLELLGDDVIEDREGCLSVPGLRGMVARNLHVSYRGRDQFGKPFDRVVSGFHARVVQHETDHLWGVLYPMRIRDMKRFGFTEVLLPTVADGE